MKNVIITGASGMIGGLVLEECLQRPDVREVTVLVRKLLKRKHEKLKQVVHADMMDLTPVADSLRGQDIAFHCVGAYTGALPRQEFRKVTYELFARFVDALKAASPQAVVCLLSGEGADRSEKSRIQFARDKGAAENHLFAAGFPHAYSFRPSYIYPVTPRREPNTMYRLLRALYPVLKPLMRGSSVPSTALAHAMVRTAFEGGPRPILENGDIRAVAGI